MFSVAPFRNRGLANEHVSQFDMAAPGTLPVLNFEAVMLGLKAAMLLNCTIPARNRFERKHYFYADMPAGYQITQQRHPIAHTGYFDGFVSYKKRIGISRIQLEIDSGKTLHDLNNNRSLIDLNRAGIGLIEIVTEPGFTSALESQCFAEQLLMILSENFITEGKMHDKLLYSFIQHIFNFSVTAFATMCKEKSPRHLFDAMDIFSGSILEGQFRVDANVSLAPKESCELGVRTEIKNLNSLQMVYNAVSYEVVRHCEILSNNGEIINETRTVDDHGRTLPMRDKEFEADYRFMPEPNLPSVSVKSEWIDNVKKTINWKPNYLMFITNYGIEPHEALRIARDQELSAFTKSLLLISKVPVATVLMWLDELVFICNKRNIKYPPTKNKFLPFFINVIQCYYERKITKFIAISLVGQFLEDIIGDNVEKVISEKQLWRITDRNETVKLVDSVFRRNQLTVQKALESQNRKLLVKLRNELIQSCGKRIDADDADGFVKDALESLKKSKKC